MLSRLGPAAENTVRPFRDGSTHVLLEPLDLMARLAALVPRPRLNITRFRRVFRLWPV
jgi:hypothetical protein